MAIGKNPNEGDPADHPDWLLNMVAGNKQTPSTFGQVMKADETNAALSANVGIVPTDSKLLQTLQKKCPKARQAVEQQLAGGCDEQTWFLWSSFLAKVGSIDDAMAFSMLSSAKYNEQSRSRIEQLKTKQDSEGYGPARCTTFGCDDEQTKFCHGSIRSNSNGEITNSPSTFLVDSKQKPNLYLEELVQEKALLLPNRYAVESNLCLVDKGKDDVEKHIPLANFFAWINKDVERDDGAVKLRYFEIEGAILPAQRHLSPVLVQAEDFESMKWPSTMWGPEPNIQPGNKARDFVRHAIQSTAKVTKNERIFAHLGWVNLDGEWRYLHAGGAVGTSNVTVDLDPRLKNYVLPDSPSDRKEAMRASLQLLDIAPHRVTFVLWALVFLSPLCEWLRRVHLEPKFLVWLHGYTGSRKTTLSQLILSHFGNLLERPPANFKDTANSLEKRAFDTKDSLLLIDDFHPTSSPHEARSMIQLAQKILRCYGDRIARGRMTQDTSLRPDYPPRGMAIVTAEDELDGGSSVARLFPVELKQTDVDLDKLTEAQRQADKLSEAMVGYLEWLGQSMTERDGKRLTEVFYDRRNEATRLNVHGRLVESASWLYLGLDIGLEYAVTVGAIDEDRKTQHLAEAWELFLSTAEEQGNQVTEVKATTRFISIVSELLANRTIYTDYVKPHSQGEVSKSGKHIGWHDDEYFYFLPSVLYNSVYQFLSAQGTQFPISEKTLWRQLADEGLILTETSKENGQDRRHNLVKKSVRGDRTRKLCVKAAVLQEKEARSSTVRKRPQPVQMPTVPAETLISPNAGAAPPEPSGSGAQATPSGTSAAASTAPVAPEKEKKKK